LGPRRLGNDDAVGLGGSLQPGGKVGRRAHCRVLLRRTGSNDIADHHQSRRDPDAHAQFLTVCVNSTDSIKNRQCGTDRPLGICITRARPAEVGEQTVAHEARHVSAEALDDGNYFGLVAAKNLAEILGVEKSGKLRRAYKIAKQDCELSALGLQR
jgi:hypothetical protein